MEIYMLEYDEETDYDGFGIEKYSLIGLYTQKQRHKEQKKELQQKCILMKAYYLSVQQK